MAAMQSFSDRNYRTGAAPQPVTKRLIDADGPDFYPTPPWASRALLSYEEFKGEIWECACGDGAMSSVLDETGQRIVSSDKYDRGFGDAGIDFLKARRVADNIVTNPPYNLSEQFVLQGIQRSRKKLALLLRLAFLEGGERCRKIFSICPPSRVWVFSERITFYPKDAVRQGGGTTAYAWFVWDKFSGDQCKLGWIEPGHKSR